jgi:hypothetical protein
MRLTLREFCTVNMLRAHAILDQVAAGRHMPQADINWALIQLGDGIA